MTGITAALVAALTGFSVMSLELAAVRLFAPHFGDSAYVWTNVIGVMLIALALGASIGGRLADPGRCAARVGRLLLIAGLATAVVPLCASALGALLLPEDLALDRASAALWRGSLVATLIAFAPPVLLAGTATPLLVTALAQAGVGVGRASGLVATWGTLGSLCGTFATTHWLVPGLGSRATVWCCAALLIAAALAVRPGRGRALALLLPIGLSLVPLGPLRAVAAPAELLAEVESRYQFLQVVRHPGSGAVAAVTELKINEGLDSFHSVRIDGTPWTGGRYYDWHAVMPWIAGDGARPENLRALSLGAAAGTFERVLAHAHPGLWIDSVEIDPEVTRLGREHFGAFGGRGAVHPGLDGRVFVNRAKGTWHLILVDAYERQVYVPAHLASVEFFTILHERLEPGGVVSVNAGGRTFDDPVVEALAATMARVFGEAWAFRVPSSRNFVLAARRGAAFDPTVLGEVRTEDPVLGGLLAAAGRPEAWRRFRDSEGAPVLRDDLPFLDAVQDEALARELDDPDPLPIAGDQPVPQVETLVHAAAGHGDWEQVLTIARTATAPSGYLRLLVGDARWRLHDIGGALAEYLAADRLEVDPELRATLRQRTAAAREQLAAFDAARSVGRRNGWLVLVGAGWLGGIALAVLRSAGGGR
jgi:spermidine synthase